MIICLKFPEALLAKLLNLTRTPVILVRDSYDTANENLTTTTRDRVNAMYEVERLDSIEEMSAVFVDIALRFPGEVSAVLSGAEYGMFGAGYLRTVLGIDHREPRLTITARDKRWMKKTFIDAGIPCAPFVSNYRPGDEISSDMFPVVAKPVAGTGSFNTAILQTVSELDSFVTSQTIHPALVSKQWSVEKKLHGEEYHADIVWNHGKPTFCSVGRYMVPRLQALQMPKRNGSIILDPSKYAHLYETFESMMVTFADAVGFKTGITHSEFFVDENGSPYISEVATRFAGAAIPQAIEAAFGVDIVDAWLHTELGLSPDLTGRNTTFRPSAQLSVTPAESGKILSIPTRAEYMSAPGVEDVILMTEAGKEYYHDNPSRWCVLLAITGNDERQVLERCDEIYENFPVVI